MDTKKLRQKILDLAIHGKLVPQDPNDEPASVLLERIKAEKEQLIKEGKIKRQKKSTSSDKSHYGNDVPFEVPEGWVWCRLKDITELIEDCPHSTAPDEGHGYPLIRTPNVGEGHLVLNGVHRVSQKVYETRTTRATPKCGDIIYAREAPAGNAAVIAENETVCLGQRTVLIRPLGAYVNPMLLTYFLLSPYSRNSLISKATGSTVQHVNMETIRPLYVPIPPFNEQIRIVAEIDRYFALVNAIEQNESSLKDAVQKAKSKILDLALSGRLTSDISHYPQLPQSQVTRWDAKTIDEIFYHNTGKALNKSDSEGELYDYITTSNLYWNKFDLSSVRKMKFKSSEIEKCSVRKGDLLICEGGDVGRAAVWNYDFNIMIQNHIHRLRCRLEANPKFYYYVMMYYKSKGMISGKGIGLMGLSSKELGKLQVPYPQIEEQNDIVTYLDYTMKVFDSIAD